MDSMPSQQTSSLTTLDVSFYNSTASTGTLATPRTTWDSIHYIHYMCTAGGHTQSRTRDGEHSWGEEGAQGVTSA